MRRGCVEERGKETRDLSLVVAFHSRRTLASGLHSVNIEEGVEGDEEAEEEECHREEAHETDAVEHVRQVFPFQVTSETDPFSLEQEEEDRSQRSDLRIIFCRLMSRALLRVAEARYLSCFSLCRCRACIVYC